MPPGHFILARVPVLVAVTAAALLMAVLLPVSGLLTDRFGGRRVYASGIAAFGLAVFPAFAVFHAMGIAGYAIALLLVFGVVHAWFYGAQGTLYASLFPARVRYTGLSTVYQLSGVYASGLTPLILTALIAVGHGSPWPACTYLVVVAGISVAATLKLRPAPDE
jgi:MFS family permease